MDELVKVNFDTQTVSARELHEQLHIGTKFTTWFERMKEYGFTEGNEFFPKLGETSESGGSEVRMKKLARVIEFVGAAIFFLCMCADATENPIVAVPTIVSLLLLYAGSRIEGGWQDAEEIVEDHDYYVDGDDTDDGITYITYDSNGTERYMDFK